MDENAGEAVDPRVKDQLEYLNSYTDEINSLELQLDDANATFRNTLSEYSQRLKQLAKKLGKCVQIARPYYDAEEAARNAKLECEEAAIRYHRACGIHKEARETISLAEKKFNVKVDEYEFDAPWQEMLNRETKKLMNAETLKEESEKEHKKTTLIFAAAVQKVKVLEQKLKKEIAKSRTYFEQKKVFLRVLQDLKSRVESLQKAVMDSKASYANCLHNLEMISKEIHDRRKLLPPREPGVGAEHEFQPHNDISIYPPLGKLQLCDSESDLAESLSSVAENEIPEDIEEFRAIAFPLAPNFSQPTLEVTSRQRTLSEPCLHSQSEQKEVLKTVKEQNLCANASWSGDNSLPLSDCTEPNVPSTPSTATCENNDVFEEVDLSCD